MANSGENSGGLLQFIGTVVLVVLVVGGVAAGIFFAGKYVGNKAGIEEGRTQAEKGIIERLNNRYEEGREVGKEVGQSIGYREGEKRGYEEGKEKGYEEASLFYELLLGTVYTEAEVKEIWDGAYKLGYDAGYNKGNGDGLGSVSMLNAIDYFLMDNGDEYDVLADPINGRERWQGKTSGVVELDIGTYYGQYGNHQANGFGVYWIKDKDTDGYTIWLGRRQNGRAQGPNIRIGSDGTYRIGYCNDGSFTMELKENGTVVKY